MAKKRTGDPWMPAVDYGRGLGGLTVNLLVSDVPASVVFAETVFEATTVYADPDFAVQRLGGAEWMVHADHTYEDHPLSGFVRDLPGRGAGVELRLHGVDPDSAEDRARRAGYTVLAGAADKPHGLREVHILDPDGYCWVADAPTAG
jgi:catechol 2,3-dioxygenase-like lactoylglutathione lyase family enzyme